MFKPVDWPAPNHNNKTKQQHPTDKSNTTKRQLSHKPLRHPCNCSREELARRHLRGRVWPAPTVAAWTRRVMGSPAPTIHQTIHLGRSHALTRRPMGQPARQPRLALICRAASTWRWPRSSGTIRLLRALSRRSERSLGWGEGAKRTEIRPDLWPTSDPDPSETIPSLRALSRRSLERYVADWPPEAPIHSQIKATSDPSGTARSMRALSRHSEEHCGGTAAESDRHFPKSDPPMGAKARSSRDLFPTRIAHAHTPRITHAFTHIVTPRITHALPTHYPRTHTPHYTRVWGRLAGV